MYLHLAALCTYAHFVSQRNVRSLPRLGVAVRGLRRDRGLTQAALADAAGISRRSLISLEAGRTMGMEIGLLMRVLDALDASLYIHDDLDPVH